MSTHMSHVRTEAVQITGLARLRVIHQQLWGSPERSIGVCHGHSLRTQCTVTEVADFRPVLFVDLEQ
jgi:hypothetical protein